MGAQAGKNWVLVAVRAEMDEASCARELVVEAELGIMILNIARQEAWRGTAVKHIILFQMRIQFR